MSRAAIAGAAALAAVVVAVVAVLALAARDRPDGEEPAVAPVSTARAGGSGRRPLPGFGFGEVAVAVRGPAGGQELCVLAATTAAQRARGLMEVTDPELGGYDGMLFAYPSDTAGSFWMRNTPMPLSIAYLDADGAVVSTADMAPCEDSPTCRSYPPTGSYRSALEVPRGRLDDLGVVSGATVTAGGACRAP